MNRGFGFLTQGSPAFDLGFEAHCGAYGLGLCRLGWAEGVTGVSGLGLRVYPQEHFSSRQCEEELHVNSQRFRNSSILLEFWRRKGTPSLGRPSGYPR